MTHNTVLASPMSSLKHALTAMSTIVLCVCLWSNSHAQGFSFDDAPEDDFLDVEEAYQVTSSINENQITFSWVAAEGYYLYRHQFAIRAESAQDKIKLEFSIPDGKTKFDEAFQKDLEVYYHDVALTAELPDWGQPFFVSIQSQGCADAGLCYPPRIQFFKVDGDSVAEVEAPSFENQSGNQGGDQTASAPDGPNSSGFDTPSTNTSLGFIILSALIGGMILNLMPCVFPVLSLKALHLASGSSAEHRINGWAYTAGVVLSFCLVAGIILVAKSAGTNLGWGFQLQQPSFVIGLIFLFFLLAMNLFGLFEVGTSWMGVGQNLTQGSGISASFFTGVLAAVVASPCTAPFMATAIGYTLTQGNIVTLVVFVSLGFGMALPYLALSHSPAIASRLPRPGPWMDTFKQFLAFPLLFTCVWLLLVFGNQTSMYAAALVVASIICVAMALWAIKKQGPASKNWLARGFALLLVAGAVKLSTDALAQKSIDANEDIWQTYSATTLSALRDDETPVFVDLTADWCITCKINERVALDTEAVHNFATTNNIVMLRGDWTKPNEEIATLLRSFKRNGVPLYLAIKGDHVEVLPQILTQSIVLEAMERSLSSN